MYMYIYIYIYIYVYIIYRYACNMKSENKCLYSFDTK